MMQDWELPDELQQLERDLAERSRRKASDSLRPRVLGDLRTRLRAERTRARWQFALAVAVVVLVWLNLSMSATQATDFGLRPARPGESIEVVADRIRQLAPELPLAEARRQAVLFLAGSAVNCCPGVSPRSATDKIRREFTPFHQYKGTD
jgi:hypothetical protein